MRSIFCSAGAATALIAASTALAAGPTSSTPPGAVFDWSGFYVGAHGGLGRGRTTVSNLDNYLSGGPATWNFNGALGGAQIGHRWQAGHMVYGAEADFSWSAMRRLLPSPFVSNESFESDVAWFGTGRLNLGYAHGGALFFLTGGVAYGEVKNSFNDTNDALFAATRTVKWGWTIGAGFEVALASNWSVRGEYLHVDLADTRASFTDANPTTYRFDFENRLHVMRLVLNYKFAVGGTR